MAALSMRANLSNAIFPFFSDMWGRSIIVPQYDQNYDRSVLPQAGATEKDKGIPQVFYMHNVLPTEYGYQSIGYDAALSAIPGGATDFDYALPLQNSALGKFIFVPAAGKNYIYDATVGAWASVSPLPPGSVPQNVSVTTAFIQGQTYINYSNYGTFYYNQSTNPVSMTQVVLGGLVDANVKGICAANGYMITWNDTTIAWSNTQNPLDFVPSTTTGAGGGSINDAKGKILYCMTISGGFLIYCERNIVAAKYTGNFAFPYIFTEVPGSAGVVLNNQISSRSNLAQHYVWTTAGMQVVDKIIAKNILPEISDFLAAKIFEDFNETTLQFTQTFLSQQLNVAVTVVSQRYVVISYGVSYPNFTHAVVYDMSLQRWGKLRITHRSCFEWNAPNLYGTITYGQLGTAGLTYGQLTNVMYGDLTVAIKTAEQPAKTIAFLGQDGTTSIVNMDLAELNASGVPADGVFILGKFQFERNFFITHQTCDVETSYNDGCNVWILPTLDGKDFITPVPATLIQQGAKTLKFGASVSGRNISHMIIGAFNLTTLVFKYTQGGQN